jgi:uncharacterized protein
MPEKKQFIFFIKPHKENFADTMTDEEGMIMSEHFFYLKGLLEQGKLVIAGPELSGKFGMGVYETESLEEAKALLDNDPAVKSGIVTPEIYPFRVSLIRNSDPER